ncbi:DUF1704 domain-containing protein [Candidatus Daviesbacteria bacterium]|nr:DUF1704 domain-containing protein [Candidatus Daviesbacteria bacterium]
MISNLKVFTTKASTIKSKLKMGTRTLTPLNYEEEKEKFFNSRYYNPTFFYHTSKFPDQNQEIIKLVLETHRLKIPDEIKEYLLLFLKDLEELNATINSIGTDNFPKYALKLFSWDLSSIKNFEDILPSIHIEDKEDAGLYGADEIKNTFQKILHKDYGLVNFPVEVDGFNPFTIRVGSKKVVVGKGVKRSSSNLKRLIVHEVESHALQFVNIKRSNNPLLKLYKYAQGELLSEGLAVYNEISTKTITKQAYDNYYFRLKATGLINKSFREIYQELIKDLSSKQAYIVTFRIKRGLKDTTKPGGFPKDAAYILGYNKIKEFLSSGNDIRLFYKSKDPHLFNLLLKHDLVNEYPLLLPKFLSS